MELTMMETEAARKEELQKKDKLVKVEKDIGVLQNGLKIAGNIIKERNNKVLAQLLKKVLTCDALTQANMQMTTGVKRKEEL